MAIQQENGRFTLKSAIGAIGESLAPFWKPMIVAAPLIGTALFFASGTNAQTSGNAVPSPTAAASGPVAPIAAPEAARTGRPKEREKMATGRVASPPTTTEPTADAPVAPIASPEAARRKEVSTQPKMLDAEPKARVANPATTTEPVATPEAERPGRPKIRGKPASNTSRTGSGSATTPSRGSNLLIPALGGAAAIAAIVAATSGNDRPTSP